MGQLGRPAGAGSSLLAERRRNGLLLVELRQKVLEVALRFKGRGRRRRVSAWA